MPSYQVRLEWRKPGKYDPWIHIVCSLWEKYLLLKSLLELFIKRGDSFVYVVFLILTFCTIAMVSSWCCGLSQADPFSFPVYLVGFVTDILWCSTCCAKCVLSWKSGARIACYSGRRESRGSLGQPCCWEQQTETFLVLVNETSDFLAKRLQFNSSSRIYFEAHPRATELSGVGLLLFWQN